MKVPFADLRRNYQPVLEDLHQAATRVIDSAHFVGGPEVKQFEQDMAKWLGVPEICSVGCATSGLYLVLRALGVGPGDEVITTVHTAIATAEAIGLCGANVVFCDIEGKGFYNLDANEVSKKITPRTKAIIPVHLYGHPANLDSIIKIAREHNLPVVEDCAQAQGAFYKGKMVGTYGDAAVFSFFPSKTLGGFGDGGAVYVRDQKLRTKVRMLANHGRQTKYDHEMEGTNSRLDAIQAAMLRVVLPLLHDWNKKRSSAASWYNEGLAGIKAMTLPGASADCQHVYHVYVVTVPERDALAKHLKEKGVETGIHYPISLNMQPAFARLKQGAGSFPRAEMACQHMLSLPLFPAITRDEVNYVTAQIKEFYR